MAIRYGARDPLLADSATQETRGLAFAVYELSDCIGAFLGPLIPIMIFSIVGQSFGVIKGLFIFSFIPNLITVLVSIRYITDTVNPEIGGQDKVMLSNKLRLMLSNRNFTLFTGIISFTTIFSVTVDLGILYLTYGSLNATPLFSSIMFSFWTASSAIAALPAGKFSDRLGRKNTVLLAFVFQSVSTLIILVYHFIYTKKLVLPLAFTFLGLYDTFLNVSTKAFIADCASLENRGILMGSYTTIEGICRRSLAPMLAGFIITTFSYIVPFILGIVISLTAILCITFTVSEP
jgi:MFS family permease